MCDGKRKYLDEATAEAALGRFIFDKHPSYPMHPYKCPQCTFWHVGHTDRGRA